MEVTAVCLTLDPARLHVDPDSLQHFEYKSMSFSCEGLDGSSGWKVERNINRRMTTCSSNFETPKESSCIFNTAYASDSGEYWCENEKGQRSDPINIAVTGGSVILESPAVPVMEGKDVTLRCKAKTTPSNLKADFYKDGFLIRTGSTQEMTIHRLSKCDEGFYKCSIFDSGESTESWLKIRASSFSTLQNEETPDSPHPLLVVKAVFTSLLMVVLVVIGLIHSGKCKGTATQHSTPH
ncbi:low affinity immunoglobulin gamma Fc region receptor II-like [Myripristis murdjan]|uniref:low affinity immunoglobulin gamma Fc region receptor II-like n=1 Tax=Myripristis murdjan TaxID=586833 RepID=UPI001175E001|nr:low affinity immunoglobulin gamma Fc region receptor II-like [Myripristis murdjan]